jgi:hypothetical protein
MKTKNGEISEHLSVLKHISTISRELHNMRIRQEFQLVVMSITLFVGCVSLRFANSFLRSGDLDIRQVLIFNCGASIGIVSMIVISGLYLVRSARANAHNQATAEAAEDTMIEYLKAASELDIPGLYGRKMELKDRNISIQHCRNREGKEFRAKHPNYRRWFWEWIVILIGGTTSAALLWIGLIL